MKEIFLKQVSISHMSYQIEFTSVHLPAIPSLNLSVRKRELKFLKLRLYRKKLFFLMHMHLRVGGRKIG